MITPESFGQQKELVETLLLELGQQLSGLLGQPVKLELVSKLDAEVLARMLEIEEEVFRIEDNVYSEDDVLECLTEEDSLCLLLYINDRVEGYTFGYDDDPEDPVVAGADYFVDSGVLSLDYQRKGIAVRISLLVLFLIFLLGYHCIGITTEEKDKSGRKLASFYRKLGFTVAKTTRPENIGMRIELTEKSIRSLARLLPRSEYITRHLSA